MGLATKDTTLAQIAKDGIRQLVYSVMNTWGFIYRPTLKRCLLMKTPALNGSSLIRFEAFQQCLLPQCQTFTIVEKAQSLQLVNDLLQDQGANIIRQFKVFLLLIDMVALVRCGGTFKNLNIKKQNTVLNSFYDSPIPLFRKGFWGLNTLARLGVYGQTSRHDKLGYKLIAIDQLNSINQAPEL